MKTTPDEKKPSDFSTLAFLLQRKCYCVNWPRRWHRSALLERAPVQSGHLSVDRARPASSNVSLTVCGLSLQLAASTSNRCFLTACRKEAKSSFPLQLTGAYRLEGQHLARSLAASHNHKHSWVSLSNGIRSPLKVENGKTTSTRPWKGKPFKSLEGTLQDPRQDLARSCKGPFKVLQGGTFKFIVRRPSKSLPNHHASLF